MADTTKLIRFVRLNGTRKFRLTVGGQTQTMNKMQALHLFDDVFRAIYGDEFNREAIRKE